jgi:hypothetical protein
MDAANEIKFAALKREIEVGIEGLERGRFHTYDDAQQFADEICRRGRSRLNAFRLKVAAKVHAKKK